MNNRELRNARVFKSAQSHYDAMEPPEVDNELDDEFVPRKHAPSWVTFLDSWSWMLGYNHPRDTPEEWEIDSRTPSGGAFLSGQRQRQEEDSSC
jgi:hypothetical protein